MVEQCSKFKKARNLERGVPVLSLSVNNLLHCNKMLSFQKNVGYKEGRVSGLSHS